MTRLACVGLIVGLAGCGKDPLLNLTIAPDEVDLGEVQWSTTPIPSSGFGLLNTSYVPLTVGNPTVIGDMADLVVVTPAEGGEMAVRGSFIFNVSLADHEDWVHGDHVVPVEVEVGAFEKPGDPDTWVSILVSTNVLMSLNCDLDADGGLAEACGGDDCDDLDDLAYEDAEEVCDGVDNDCDGTIDLLSCP